MNDYPRQNPAYRLTFYNYNPLIFNGLCLVYAPESGVVGRVLHNRAKYLLLRGKTFHFRWRVPAELRSIFGATELRRSLRTTDHLQARVRAGRFVATVAGIRSAQRGFVGCTLA